MTGVYEKSDYDMFFDKISVNEMSWDEVSVDEMSVDEMSVDDMYIDEISVDNISVDIIWTFLFLNHPSLFLKIWGKLNSPLSPPKKDLNSTKELFE